MQVESYKIGSITFYSCRFWYYKNGKKHSKKKSGFKGKKEAEKWGRKEKERLEGLQSSSDKTTLGQFLKHWIEFKEDKISPTTLSGYKVNIKHINKFLENAKLSRLKLIDVQGMVDNLRNGYKDTILKDGKKQTIDIKPLKYRSVKYVVRTLHAAMEYALINEYIEKNPCKGVEIREDEEEFEVIVYTADDLNRLILALREQDHPLYPAVLLSSMRGLRRGETLGLRWSDIDFDKGVAYIRNNYVVVGGQAYHRKVKTKESERIIDMEGFLSDELKAYKESIISQRKGIPVYVCETESGILPHPSHISRTLKQFQKTHGLPECRFHDLRHTFAVLQLEEGTDLDTLKRLLGHSKIGITSDLYLHENVNLIKKSSSKLDNVLKLGCDKSVTNSKNGSTGAL